MAPVPENIMDNDQDMSYNGERPLEISVDVSSDEEDFDDDDTEEYGTALHWKEQISAAIEMRRPFFTMNWRTLMKKRVFRIRQSWILITWRKSAFLFSLASTVQITNTSTEIPALLEVGMIILKCLFGLCE